MLKRLYVPGLLLALAVVLIYIYASYNPGTYALFPKCPFHVFFGLDCPGCGTQRAVHALLNGNLYAAADYNLLLVLSLPLLLAQLCCKMLTFFTTGKYELKFLNRPVTPVIIGIIVVVFWVARNIPIYPLSFLAA